MSGFVRRRTAAIGLSLGAAAILGATSAQAAGGAYQVDTSEVSDENRCKVESWVSWASNRDFLAASTPSCSMQVGRPLELSAQFSRFRVDGEWGTAVTPKSKVNLLPSGIGVFGLAVTANPTFDLVTGDTLFLAAAVPMTMRLSDVMRINVNLGLFWDRTVGEMFGSYGLGFDLRTPDNVWTLTAEVFGLVGNAMRRQTNLVANGLHLQ